jgi:hypothetical protein
LAEEESSVGALADSNMQAKSRSEQAISRATSRACRRPNFLQQRKEAVQFVLGHQQKGRTSPYQSIMRLFRRSISVQAVQVFLLG